MRVASEKGAIGKLIQKLEHRSSEINSSVATVLAPIIARRGALFPHEKGSFAFVTEPFARSAILVSKLLERVASTERDYLARKVVVDAQPLPFAAECFRWLKHDKDSQEVLLSEATETELGHVLAERISAEAQGEPLYLRYPERSAMLLGLWKRYGGGAAMSDILQARFSIHPEEIIPYLTQFTGQAYSMETGLPTRTEFPKDAYDSSTSYLGSDVIMSILRKQYGESIGEGSFYVSDEAPFDLHIAHQFAFVAMQAAKGLGPQSDL